MSDWPIAPTAKTLAVFWPSGYEPPTSNFATLNVRNQHPVLEFDTTTQETAIWTGFMPVTYAGQALVVTVVWCAASATTGTIGWDATFERIDAGTLDIDGDGWATAQTITAATVNAATGVTSATSVTCAVGSAGTDSIGASDPFRLRIRRDVTNDTAAGDAQLLLVVVGEA